MQILVTGCTSPVGEEFVKTFSLENKNSQIRCFVRHTSNVEMLRDKNIEFVYGDLRDVASIKKSLEGVELIVHIAGIMFIPYILEALRESKLERGIFINTTGIFSKFKSAAQNYHVWEAEMDKFFSETNFKYAFIRPTMIYGSHRDHNVRKFALYLNKHSFFPIFGGGSALIQPVYYKDVAKALVALVENEQCWGKAYNISGGTAITYRRFIETIAETLGKKVRFIRLPLQLTVWAVSILNRIIPSFPLKVEQMLRTTEGRAFDYTDAKNCFGYNPISFEEGIKLEIEELKRDGYLI